MSSQPLILIAGAGPSGLILALTLAMNNVPVRIIEKDTAFHRGQRGSGIQPRTLELFNYLGCLQDFMEQSTHGSKVCLYKMPNGREVAKIADMAPHLEPTPDVPFRNPRLIGQCHNEEILRSHLAKYNVNVELGTQLVSFKQDEDGVTAQLLRHGQEAAETVRVQYLVSAEGARSIVRKELGIPFVGETKESMRILLVDAYLEGIDNNYWHRWGDISSKLVWVRKTEREGLFSIMIGGTEVDTAALAADREALLDFIREFTQHPEINFKEVINSSEFRPNIRMADKFSEGRAFLIGDAAHVHSPTGGQGLNTGVQDSFNLGWKLSLVCKGLAPPSLLETYSDERLPVVTEMLGLTTQLMRKTAAYKAGNEDASHVRRDKSLHQLGVNYRWSSIVVDEQPGTEEAHAISAAYGVEDPSVLRAGDRAPDAPGLAVVGEPNDSEMTSLFSIYKPTRHTVLLFTTDAAEAKPIVDALKAVPEGVIRTVLILPKDYDTTDIGTVKSTSVDTIVVDSEGHAHTYYPPAGSGFNTIVVRPDGVVGAVLKSVDGLKTYLKAVFGV